MICLFAIDTRGIWVRWDLDTTAPPHANYCADSVPNDIISAECQQPYLGSFGFSTVEVNGDVLSIFFMVYMHLHAFAFILIIIYFCMTMKSNQITIS